MARLFLAAKKQQRRRVKTAVKHCHNGRISPEGEDDVKMMSAGSKLMSLEDIDEFSAAEFMHRISNSKSKKPKLETIAEEESSLRISSNDDGSNNGGKQRSAVASFISIECINDRYMRSMNELLIHFDFYRYDNFWRKTITIASVTRLKENCCILKITTVAAGIDWNMNLLQPLVKL
ncbi:hypothetical protein YC2023_034781 [Brassica napus]